MTRWLVALGFALGASLVAGLLGQIGLLQTLELKTYDARMRAVATGDGAHARRSRWCSSTTIPSASSSRRWDAGRGRACCTACSSTTWRVDPAKLVVYDVQFSEADKATPRDSSARRGRARNPTTRSSRSVRQAGNVIVAVQASSEGLVDESQNVQPPLDQRGVARPRLSPQRASPNDARC